MTFTLRPYAASDFETLYAIDQQCYPRAIAYSRTVLRWFLKRPGAYCVVAQLNAPEPDAGTLAGFLIAEADGPEATIITLDVSEAYRRARLGTALVANAEGALAERGVRSIAIETAVNNEAGVAFWKRHEYQSLGVLKNYYPGKLDAYYMVKQL